MESRSRKKKSRPKMVITPNTLSESCERLYQSLAKIQPNLGMELHSAEALDFFVRNYPNSEKQVTAAIKKILKATTHCHVCKESVQSSGHCVVLQTINWDDLEYSPKSVKVLCSKCRTICSWQNVMSVYLNQTLLDSESAELSTVVEHYLRVNGHRMSDISLFNAALSVFASLRACESQLNLSLRSKQDIDVLALVNSLVSRD